MRQRTLAPQLIGRQPELAELAEHLARARSGAGQLVLLSGEAGVGKSRLLREFAQSLAGDPAVSCFTGYCYDEQPAAPYGPFAELLARLGQADAPALAGLRALLAEQARPGDVEGLADPQAERRRLFHAIYQALRPADGRAHVLILEDLHWSDQASHDLLLFLARAVEDDRVLIVGTFRADEIHRLHPLAALIARLTRDRRLHELRLDPLNRAELAELLAVTMGAEPPAALIAALYERTEGNPFFAEEVLGAMLAEGGFDAADPARTLGLGGLPISIKDSILRRVAALDDATAAVARAAAVVGRRFDFELLLRLTGLGEAALLRCLAALVERQLIVEEPGDSEDRYRFRHELIRQALYEEMLRRERRIRHLEVLRALEELQGPDGPGDDAVDQLAYHALSARALPEAARYSLRAGERASRVHAYREALGHFEAALEAGEQAASLDEHERADLLARMGTAAYLIGDLRRAAAFWGEALPLYERLGARRRAADVLRWLGRCAWDGGDKEGAFARTRAALALLEGEEPCRELAMACSALSHLYMFETLKRPDAAADCIAWGRKALAMGETIGDDGVITHALNNIGVALSESGQTEEGLGYLRRSLALALAADLPADAVRASINLCGQLPGNRRHEALAIAREGYAYAARLGHIRGSGKLLTAICRLALELGAWDEMETLLREALRPGSPFAQEERPKLQFFLACLFVERGRYGDARDILEALLPQAADDRDGLVNILELRVFAHHELGEQERALALADQLREQLLAAAAGDLACLGLRAFNLVANVEVYLAAGRRADAEAIVATLSAVGERHAQHEHVLAIVCELRGIVLMPQRPAEAAAEFARAIALNEASGGVPNMARARRRRAEALLLLGGAERRAEARAELGAARAAAERLQMLSELTQIAALEQRLAPQAVPAPQAPPPAPQPRPIEGLTPRELEVLTLITRGLSNRAIAEALVISEKTAEVHVRNILGKLGFSSRTQAATFAVERGLAARSA
jgi:ATP/maltotriose-dependent transcriptional regulator MalT